MIFLIHYFADRFYVTLHNVDYYSQREGYPPGTSAALEPLSSATWIFFERSTDAAADKLDFSVFETLPQEIITKSKFKDYLGNYRQEVNTLRNHSCHVDPLSKRKGTEVIWLMY